MGIGMQQYRGHVVSRAVCFAFLGALAAGLSLGLFASEPAYASRGMYYQPPGPLVGNCWYLSVRQEDYLVQVDLNAWQYGTMVWQTGHSQGFEGLCMGTPSGCFFNGKLYCFYVVEPIIFGEPGGLYCFTIGFGDDGTWVKGPAQLIASGDLSTGCAAAVSGDAIWVFTAHGVYTSSDGKNFATTGIHWWGGEGSHPPVRVLDAVTFYPMGDDPARIMVAYTAEDYRLATIMFDPSSGAVVGPPQLPDFTPSWGFLASGALLLGTSSAFRGFPGGALAPCVQFYGMTQDGHQGRWEYHLANRTWSFTDITVPGTTHLIAWPYFTVEDSAKGTMQQAHILEYGYQGHSFIHSDWMIPQNYDSAPNGYGWTGLPTPTQNAISGSDTDKQLRSLWTLVGIVLGPPPFALNGASDASGISSVVYATESGTTITSTETVSKTVSVASSSQIKGGFGKFTLDLSYAHGWTSNNGASQTVDVQTQYTFGPQDETPPDQGVHGWALFYAPVLVTQWYKLYAYDKATYLDQDIYATSVGDAKTHVAYFSLANPSDGSIPGLMDGFSIFPNSTDLNGWSVIQDWNAGGSDWDVLFGDQSQPSVDSLDEGTTTSVTYTQTDTSTQSNGNSNSFSVSAGASFNLFGGFSTGVTVGYDADYSTSTEVDSTVSKGITCSLAMPIPDNPGDVTGLDVQPYWLRAKNADAPWIPAGYDQNLPWCLTWNVTGYHTLGGATAGLAAPPESASGTIRHGMEKQKNHYEVVSGRLRWQDSHGLEAPIPLTADQFDPSKGAAVDLGGHLFPADGSKGKWVRKGDAWKYRTRDGVKQDPFTLLLDFASQTWSFDGSSKSLDQEIKTAEGNLRVELDVEGSYRFSTWLKHDVDSAWSHSEKKADWQAYGVHEAEGAYNSAAGAGNLKLKGHIPKKVDSFGDLEIRVNGSPVRIPLLSLDGFLDDLDRARTVKYETDGLFFEIDFQTGQWKAMVEGAQFKSDMAPRKGVLRVQLLVGGRSLSDQTLPLQKHKTLLAYGG
jgi:hypothetical protein